MQQSVKWKVLKRCRPHSNLKPQTSLFTPKICYYEPPWNIFSQQQKWFATACRHWRKFFFFFFAIVIVEFITHEQCVLHSWGQRLCRGQLRWTTGQITQELPERTKLGRKNPCLKYSALMDSKVMQGSARVNQGSNCLEIPYGYQIW